MSAAAMDSSLPRVLFGTSSLGNLFSEPTHAEKKAVVEQILAAMPTPVFDSAGKYGAGLALEELGKCLEELGVAPDKVLISNKLGWKRVPLTTPEPTFEPGAWVNLQNDAVQDISYDGILACYEQGNALLGKYSAQIISVHDPDEYLNAAKDAAELAKRQADVLGAYKALSELKAAGKVRSIGVGAKDIRVIDFIVDNGVQLDWAMFACSITPYTHSEFARGLLRKLGDRGVRVINSAVFNAGFLIGGDHFDYRKVTRESDPDLYAWRDKFNAICVEFGVSAAEVCVQFSFLFPQVSSVALNTTRPSRVRSNVELANARIPAALWSRLQTVGLISVGPPVTLRHSVHLQLTPEATDEQKSAMAAALRKLPLQIFEIASLHCGLDAGLAAGNHGFCLTVDFADAAAYQVYATHPAHLEVIQTKIKPILVPGSRIAVQFELGRP
jgi:D-threo-aldose 1-dehydrogenase